MLAALVVATLASPPAEPSPAPSDDPEPPRSLRDEVSLVWVAPPECPDGLAFIAAVEALSGRRLEVRPDADQQLDANIRTTATGYALHLELTSPGDHTTRDLEAPDCAAVTDAASLVVMTRWLSDGETDETDETEVPLPEPAPEPTPPPATPPSGAQDPSPTADPRPSTDPPPPRGDRPEPRRRPVGARLAFAALGGGAFGFTPRATGAVAGVIALLLPRARVELQVQHAFATSTDDVGGGRVRAALTRIGSLGCFAPTVGKWDFPACTGLDLGVAVGRGEGELSASDVRRQTWIGLPVTAGLGWALRPRVALRASGGLSIGLRRPGFHLATPQGERGVFRVPAVVGSLLAGIEVRLP